MDQEREIINYKRAVAWGEDEWVAACGGMETPFEYAGKKVLYVFNPARNEHGYLDMGSDIVFQDIELTTPA